MAERVWRPPTTAQPSAEDVDGIRIRHGVKALVTTGSKALVVRERHVDGTPFWTLPGGGVHPGESAVGALERELAEELRCQSVVRKPVGSFWYAHSSLQDTVSVYTVLACDLLTQPQPARDEGVSGVRWVSSSSMPPRTLPQVRRLVDRTV